MQPVLSISSDHIRAGTALLKEAHYAEFLG
jgi:hypothetical protein